MAAFYAYPAPQRHLFLAGKRLKIHRLAHFAIGMFYTVSTCRWIPHIAIDRTPREMGEKICVIRDTEGLTRQQLFVLTGIPAGISKYYETGRVESSGSNVLLKITLPPHFAKYTLWLMTDNTAPEAGQIDPAFEHYGPSSHSGHKTG